MKYVREAKNYQLFAYILQYFHLQRTLHKQLINEVRIQLKLLLVQGCQTYGPQAESDNVPLGILNKLEPSDIFPIIIAAFTSGIYKAEHPVFRRFLACQIGNMR